MQRKSFLGLALGAGAFLAFGHSAHAARVVYYSFDTFGQGAIADGTSIPNGGTGATAGKLSVGTDAGGSLQIVPSGIPGGGGGKALQLTPAADGSAFGGAPNIDTMFTATALSVTPGTAYTAMAWVKFNNANGDNMVFGQGAGNVLHLGSRDGNLHSGHWGDDLNSGKSADTGNWHHVAYTNDGAAGNQAIYVDGNLIDGPGAGGAGGGMDVNIDVLIGTSGNGGSLNGVVDEVKIFNTQLSAAQIQSEMAVPEPTSGAVIVLGGLAVAGMSRRRAAR